MFDKIDLEKILRNGIATIDNVDINLDELYNNDHNRTMLIRDNIFRKSGRIADFYAYNSSDIFPLHKIKELCIKYHLRFLDSHHFIGEIPLEAINKIKYLEDQSNQEFKSFKIIAPARRFQLEDENADPLLFINLGNDKFLLVHKWGSDLCWYQKILKFPIQTYSHLALTALLFSASLALLIPNNWLSTLVDVNYLNIYRLFFFFWISIVSLSVISFLWMSFRKNVSVDSWNKNTF